jgi:hypothetical protein
VLLNGSNVKLTEALESLHLGPAVSPLTGTSPSFFIIFFILFQSLRHHDKVIRYPYPPSALAIPSNFTSDSPYGLNYIHILSLIRGVLLYLTLMTNSS